MRPASSESPFSPADTAVIWNPVAGRPSGRRRARRLVDRLRQAGYRVSATERAGHAAELSAAAVEAGSRALVVLGGDGTLCQALSAIPPAIPFAFHASGTVNLFARALGLPPDPDAWLALLESGTTGPVHVARCNGTPFLSVASAGFDATVCARVGARSKRLLQEGAYALRALREWPFYRVPAFRVTLDDDAAPIETGPLVGVLVGKGPFYGGRHRLLPAADLSKPTLEVALLGGKGRGALLRIARGLVTGSLARDPRVTYRTARRVTIEASPAADVQIDGEAHGVTPARFDVDPAPRRALAPVTP